MLCLEVLKIGFTCKSRFCSKCGKKYVSQWVEKQEDKILDVPHRHCVFTMPEEFRNYFYWNKEKIKDLQDMVHEVVAEYANGVNKGNRAEYRIIGYDGEKVTFWYKSHETNERVVEVLDAERFVDAHSAKVF